MAEPALVEWKIDKGYVLHMLLHIARSEMKNSRAFIADDNPWGCTEEERTAWTTYRKAWLAIANGPKKYINFTGTGEDIIGVTRPPMPTGWVCIMRQIGDVPPLTCRISDFDIFDPTLPADPTGFREKRTQPNTAPDGTAHNISNEFMRESE